VGLFGGGTFLEAQLEAWTFETWAWLLTNLGGLEKWRGHALVLPTKDFFPPTESEGHARALYVFETVKRWMGLAGWECELEAFERRPANARVGQYHFLRDTAAPNGTFRVEDGRVIISYATDLVARPRDLIATLAHELSHYLVATIRKPMPGGREAHELVTELCVAYTGFGVFAANRAFYFAQQHDAGGQGWRYSLNGYFSERSWAFSLAIFAALKENEIPRDQLKRSVADLVQGADRYLKRHPALLAPLLDIT
jgi:hypothetical protein